MSFTLIQTVTDIPHHRMHPLTALEQSQKMLERPLHVQVVPISQYVPPHPRVPTRTCLELPLE
jgi:hypothetical protein